MKCKNCEIEYKPKRKTSFFCSDKCRASFNRKLANGEIANAKKIANGNVPKISVPRTDIFTQTTTTSDTINRWGKNVKEMDAETLYAFIRAYPSDTWKDSPEFKELKERLKKPVKWLREQGYWIPSWKEPYRV